MIRILLLSISLLGAVGRAEIPLVNRRSFQLEVSRCFTRVPVYPDPERVDPHLPSVVCIGAISGVLPFDSEGSLLFVPADGPSARASVRGKAHYGADRDLNVHQAPLKIMATRRGYRAWVVVDETPEDPAGDAGRTLVGFDLDAGGRPIEGTAFVQGLVECTFAPVCREENLEIEYEDAEPIPR